MPAKWLLSPYGLNKFWVPVVRRILCPSTELPPVLFLTIRLFLLRFYIAAGFWARSPCRRLATGKDEIASWSGRRGCCLKVISEHDVPHLAEFQFSVIFSCIFVFSTWQKGEGHRREIMGPIHGFFFFFDYNERDSKRSECLARKQTRFLWRYIFDKWKWKKWTEILKKKL